MDNNEKKAYYYLAKYLALSNASELIKGHGEEGHSFEDEDLNTAYQKEQAILYKQLDARANVFRQKYEAMGFDIESITNENY